MIFDSKMAFAIDAIILIFLLKPDIANGIYITGSSSDRISPTLLETEFDHITPNGREANSCGIVWIKKIKSENVLSSTVILFSDGLLPADVNSRIEKNIDSRNIFHIGFS